MDELEIVISDLQDISEILINNGYGGWAITIGNAIALLKEQDAKQVNISQTHYEMKYGLCPRCEKQIDTLVNPHYCGNCGQELKWE